MTPQRIKRLTLEMVLLGIPEEGFWTCQKFYGLDGLRIAP